MIFNKLKKNTVTGTVHGVKCLSDLTIFNHEYAFHIIALYFTPYHIPVLFMRYDLPPPGENNARILDFLQWHFTRIQDFCVRWFTHSRDFLA